MYFHVFPSCWRRSKACGRFVPSLPLRFVSFEVGSDQPSNRFRLTVLKHGESTTAVRMGCYCKAISWRFCSRIATEGDQTQLQVAGPTHRQTNLLNFCFKTFLMGFSGRPSITFIVACLSQHILVSCLLLQNWNWKHSIILHIINHVIPHLVALGLGILGLGEHFRDAVGLQRRCPVWSPSVSTDESLCAQGSAASGESLPVDCQAQFLSHDIWWYLMIFLVHWYPLMPRYLSGLMKSMISDMHCASLCIDASTQGQSISEVSLRWRCWCYAELFRFCLCIFISVVWPCENGLANALDVWYRFASIPHYEVPAMHFFGRLLEMLADRYHFYLYLCKIKGQFLLFWYRQQHWHVFLCFLPFSAPGKC